MLNFAPPRHLGGAYFAIVRHRLFRAAPDTGAGASHDDAL